MMASSSASACARSAALHADVRPGDFAHSLEHSAHQRAKNFVRASIIAAGGVRRPVGGVGHDWPWLKEPFRRSASTSNIERGKLLQ